MNNLEAFKIIAQGGRVTNPAAFQPRTNVVLSRDCIKADLDMLLQYPTGWEEVRKEGKYSEQAKLLEAIIKGSSALVDGVIIDKHTRGVIWRIMCAKDWELINYYKAGSKVTVDGIEYTLVQTSMCGYCLVDYLTGHTRNVPQNFPDSRGRLTEEQIGLLI